MISVGNNKAVICKGDFHPAQLYKGDKKIAGYTVEEFEGTGGVTLENCYNDKLHNVQIFGNSIQDGTPTPENPVEIQSVGELVTEGEYAGKYKIPVTARGKNLLDVSRAGTKTVTVSGITVEPYGVNGFRVYGVPTTTNNIVFRNGSTTTRHRTYIKKDAVIKTSVHLDKTYNNVLPSGTRIKFQCSLYDKSWNWATNAQTSNVIKTPSDIYVIGYNTPQLVAIDTETYLDFVFYPQVEIVESSSSSATPYEPYIEPQTFNIYLDELLRRNQYYNRSCPDYVTCEPNKFVRYNYEEIYDGTELWEPANSSYPNTFCKRITTARTVLCSHYPTSFGVGTDMTASASNSARFYVTDSRFSTVEEFKTFLAEQAASGSPVTAVFLAQNAYNGSPIEEPIELPELPTFKGTTIYEIATDIPATISGKYKKVEV